MPASQRSSNSPIRLGYCLSLSGPMAGEGRATQLAHQIWLNDVNHRGGLLGRPVELVCYDDEATAGKVPFIYRHLLDEDKVDLVFGGYGANTLLPAMPLVMDRRRFFVGLLGAGVNNALRYPNYFALSPTGPDPDAAMSSGFFSLAAEQRPRPTTVALLSADEELSRSLALGAEANAANNGFTVVHESIYPLETKDFKPFIDEVERSRADLLFLCAHCHEYIGLVRAIRAHTFRPKMVGAGIIGPQSTTVKTTLGPLLNGIVNCDYWAPVPKLMFAGVERLLQEYRSRAASASVDILSHTMAPLAYAQMQVIEKAIEATSSLDCAALAAYARDATFYTVMGEVKFGVNGEWSEPRVIQVQFQGIDSHLPEQFADDSRQVAVSPASLASGKLVYPYVLAL